MSVHSKEETSLPDDGDNHKRYRAEPNTKNRKPKRLKRVPGLIQAKLAALDSNSISHPDDHASDHMSRLAQAKLAEAIEPFRNVQPEFRSLSQQGVVDEYKKRMNGDKVCCMNLSGESNIGQIVRTASLFEMSEVIILGRRKYNRRSTVGSHNYIPVTTLMCTEGNHSENFNIPSVLKFLAEWSQTHTIVFVELRSDAISARDFKTSLPSDKQIMFVMGSEHDGIPEEVLAFQPSLCVEIPQKGVMRCFNVSNAFAIVAWEYYR